MHLAPIPHAVFSRLSDQSPIERGGKWYPDYIATLLAPRLSSITVALFTSAVAHASPAAEVVDPESASTTARQASRESWLVPSLHSLGLMVVMRGTETYLWPEPFAKVSWFAYHYEQAFTRPPLYDGSRPLFEADGDRWTLNVVGHGLFGSELYLRARACRKPIWQALAFATASTTLWEYGFEANGVRPSALDLVYTPAAGLALGEARFQLLRWARGMKHGPGRRALGAVVDPLGELERLLGAPC
jgi:hypothetical protein